LARMNLPWAPPTPIEVLFKQLTEGQRFALAAAEPIADTLLVRMGYQLVLKTGMFADGCRDWRLRPEADQTWANFQTHFARQDRDRLETTTTAGAGYTPTAYAAVGSPALATIPAPPVVLPGAPSSACALAAVPSGPPCMPTGAELTALLSELRLLRAAAAKSGPSAASPLAGARGYCWTHGSTANGTHTSATCKNKASGHIDSATWRNKQGGNPNTYVPRSRRLGATTPPTGTNPAHAS
jgi:hypothetical protein